jgi:hypothetical protein
MEGIYLVFNVAVCGCGIIDKSQLQVSLDCHSQFETPSITWLKGIIDNKQQQASVLHIIILANY